LDIPGEPVRILGAVPRVKKKEKRRIMVNEKE
jgi:hypothetical protein